MQMESTMTYSEPIPCFRKKGSLEKIWLPFPVFYNFSCKLLYLTNDLSTIADCKYNQRVQPLGTLVQANVHKEGYETVLQY